MAKTPKRRPKQPATPKVSEEAMQVALAWDTARARHPNADSIQANYWPAHGLFAWRISTYYTAWGHFKGEGYTMQEAIANLPGAPK